MNRKQQLAIAAGILLLCQLPCRAVLVKVRPVFEGGAKERRGFPVRVELTTRNPFRGRISARIANSDACGVSMPVNIGPGRFKYEIPVPLLRSGYAASIVIVSVSDENGLEFFSQEFAVDVVSSRYVYEYRAQSIPPLVAWVHAAGTRRPRLADPVLAFCTVQNERLPEDWRMYDAVDCVVLPGAVSWTLAKTQVEALLAWVQSGGRLVLDGFCPEDRIGQNIIFRKLGVTLGKPLPETSIVLPWRETETPHNATMRMPLRPIVLGSARSVDGQSIRSVAPHGLGSIAITCADLQAPAEGLRLQGFLVGQWSGIEARGWCEERLYDYYGRLNQPFGEYPDWAVTLFHLCGLETIGAWIIMLFLAAFIALVAPVERIILSKLKGLRWGWWTTLAIVFLFCLGANEISIAARGIRSRRGMVCVHDYAASDGGGRHTMFDCFIPSHARAYPATYGQDDIVTDLSAGLSGCSGFFDHGVGRLSFSSPVWSHHFLLTKRAHREPAPFRCAVAEETGAMKGHAELGASDMAVKSVWLARNGRLYEMVRDALSDRRWILAPAVGTPVSVIEPPRGAHETGDWNQNQYQVERAWMFNLAALTAPALAHQAGTFFGASTLPAMEMPDDSALLMAACEDGPKLDIDAWNPKRTEIHIVRQVVRLRGDGRAAPAP